MRTGVFHFWVIWPVPRDPRSLLIIEYLMIVVCVFLSLLTGVLFILDFDGISYDCYRPSWAAQ